MLSPLRVCQATPNQLRVVEATLLLHGWLNWLGHMRCHKHLLIPQNRPMNLTQNSCIFLKTNLIWAFHLLSLLPKQSGPEIAELLNTQHKTNPFPQTFKTTFTDPQSYPSPLLVLLGCPSRLAELVASLSFLEIYHPWKNLETSPQSCPLSGAGTARETNDITVPCSEITCVFSKKL